MSGLRATADLPTLERLARDAMTSPYAEVRAAAADQLRFLSTYDYWDSTKSILSLTRDPHLQFVLAKSIHFVVSNEIGPSERAEMMDFILDYIRTSRCSGVPLPRHVQNVLFTVFAAALFLNWRIMMIAADDDGTRPTPAPSLAAPVPRVNGAETPVSSSEQVSRMVSEDSMSAASSSTSLSATNSVGPYVESLLTRYLEPTEVLDCVKEVIYLFAKEEQRASGSSSMRSAFGRTILPHFFRYALLLAPSLGSPALELMALILESVPQSGTAPIVTVAVTTDDSIYVNPGLEWAASLQNCVAVVVPYVIEHPDPSNDELTECMLRILRLVSAVCIADWSSRHVTRDAIDATHQELLRFSITAAKLCEQRPCPQLLTCAVAVLVNCFERDELSVGLQLVQHPDVMNGWAGIASACFQRWSDDEEEARQLMMHLFFLIGTRAMPQPSTSETPDETASRTMLEQRIRLVFLAYLSAALANAHLSEDSHELRCKESVVLRSEEFLQPLGELLFIDRLGLGTELLQEWSHAMKQYHACLAMQRGESVDEATMLSILVGASNFFEVMGSQDAALFLTNVTLSRMSTLILVVAIGIRMSSVFPTDPILDAVSTFLNELTSADGALVDSLLNCLSLGGSPASGQRQSQPVRKIHLGVIRALFHYAHAVMESDFGRHRILEDGIRLVAYVVNHHSDVIPLVRDANLLFSLYLSSNVTTPTFLKSELMDSLYENIKQRHVALLSPNLSMVPQETFELREELLTLLSAYLGLRIQHGFHRAQQILDSMVDLVGPAFAEDATLGIRDLCGLVSGCSTEASLLNILDWIGDNGVAITTVLRNNGPTSQVLRRETLRLWAIATEKCAQLLSEDNLRVTTWAFASLVFNSTKFLLASTTVRRPGGDDFYFPASAVSETELYDICTIVASTLLSHWCNISVMSHYGEEAVEDVLLMAVEVLVSIPVEVLIAHENRRHRVFQAVMACLGHRYALKSLQLTASITAVWPRVLEHMLRCVEYRFSHLATKCIHGILQMLWPNAQNPPVARVSPTVVQRILKEVVTGLSTITLAEETFPLAFEVMRMCYDRCPGECEQAFEQLLSFCSAYHRVRIRCMLMMLRVPQNHSAAESYLSVFGVVSKVPTLAAW